MPKVVQRVWGILTTVLIVIVLVLAMLLVGVRLIGFRPYAVLSGSMEPNYHVGSMIYVREVDPSTLKVGDPITFYLNSSTVATHRIIEVLPDGSFRTQGDANESPDSTPVKHSAVIGKPLFTIPYLGYLSEFVQHQPGRSIALGSCTALLIFAIVPTFFSQKNKEEATDAPNAEHPSEKQL